MKNAGVVTAEPLPDHRQAGLTVTVGCFAERQICILPSRTEATIAAVAEKVVKMNLMTLGNGLHNIKDALRHSGCA